MVTLREASLRPDYQAWYPGIRAGTWLPADFVAHAVRREREQGKPSWEVGARVLSDGHFQFRGGRKDRSRTVRTRAGERSVLQPRLW
jgi:hypothetical protein